MKYPGDLPPLPGVIPQTIKQAADESGDAAMTSAIVGGSLISPAIANELYRSIERRGYPRVDKITGYDIDELRHEIKQNHPNSQSKVRIRFFQNIWKPVVPMVDPAGGNPQRLMDRAGIAARKAGKSKATFKEIADEYAKTPTDLYSSRNPATFYHEVNHLRDVLKAKVSPKLGLARAMATGISGSTLLNSKGQLLSVGTAAVAAGATGLIEPDNAPIVGAAVPALIASAALYDEARTSTRALVRDIVPKYGKSKALKYYAPNLLAAFGTYAAGAAALSGVGYGIGKIVQHFMTNDKDKKIEGHFKEALECFEGFCKVASSIEVEALSTVVLRRMFKEGI